MNQYNSFEQIVDSLDFFNTDWVVNIETPYDNENTLIENLSIFFSLKKYSELEKLSLFKDVYTTVLKKYISYLALQHLKCKIDELTIDFVLNDLFKTISLSKSFSIVYYSISSTEKNMKKYNYSDQKKVNTHFRNRVLQSIELHNKQEIVIKDFNLPPSLSINHFQDYVVDSIFNHRDTYFYLPVIRIL